MTQTLMNQTLTSHLARPRNRLLAVTLGVALACGIGQAAFAQTAAPAAASAHGGMMMDHGGRHGGGMQGMGGMGFMQPRMLERALDSVNASADQRAQIRQIVMAAMADLRVQHQSGRALHDQAASLFTQPTVDARAAESLRQQMLAQHDQASKRMLQAMLDVSRVLTPEQRKALADRMAQRRAMMERHHAERAASAPAR